MEAEIRTLWTKVNGNYEILGYDIIVNGEFYKTCEDLDELIAVLTQLKEEERASSEPKD